MMRLLLILLGAALPTLVVANGLFMFAPGNGGAGGSLCPMGTSFTDGCSAAVSGTANDPTLLNSYGANRPPWNVAGVDYRVGNDGGALADPTTTLPGCATYSAGTVTVSSAPCTLDHLDFSLHNGVCINITATSGTVTITNNKFVAGTNCNPSGTGFIDYDPASNTDTVVKYNSFDMLYNSNWGVFISNRGTPPTSRDVEYNVFLHGSQHNVGLWIGTTIVKYNYAKGIGCCGGHGDWIVFYTTTGTTTIDEEFNTVTVDDTPPQGLGANNATAYCYMANFSTANVGSGSKCTNDTYISRLRTGDTGPASSYPIRVEPAGTWGTVAITNNYIDIANGGAFGFIESTTLGSTGAVITCTGNKDLSTGNAITTVVGGFFTCT